MPFVSGKNATYLSSGPCSSVVPSNMGRVHDSRHVDGPACIICCIRTPQLGDLRMLRQVWSAATAANIALRYAQPSTEGREGKDRWKGFISNHSGCETNTYPLGRRKEYRQPWIFVRLICYIYSTCAAKIPRVFYTDAALLQHRCYM